MVPLISETPNICICIPLYDLFILPERSLKNPYTPVEVQGPSTWAFGWDITKVGVVQGVGFRVPQEWRIKWNMKWKLGGI